MTTYDPRVTSEGTERNRETEEPSRDHYNYDDYYNDEPAARRRPQGSDRPASYRTVSSTSTTSGGKLASGASLGVFTDEQALFLQDLVSQGYDDDTIKHMFQQKFGMVPEDYEIRYLREGDGKLLQNKGGYKYSQYGSYTQSLSDGYPAAANDPMKLLKMIQQQQSVDENKNLAYNAKQQSAEDTAKMKRYLLMILMGDLPGLLQAYLADYYKDKTKLDRLMVKNLGLIRRVKQTIIHRMALYRPPKMTASRNPTQQANAQNRMNRYTQWLQGTTQFLSQVGDAERLVMETMTSSERDYNTKWELFTTIRDAHFRILSRIADSR